MTTNIAIRLQAEGAGEIKRAFDDVGNSGRTAFDGVTSALDRTGAASDKVVEKVRQAGEAARAAQGAAGGSGSGSGTTSAREVERIRTQLDTEYAKQKQLDRAGSVIDRGYSAGYFDDAERARLSDLAAQRYGAAAPRNDNARGLDSRDRSFIQYSAFSGVSSLTAGASAGTVVAQQGAGIVQLLADREGGLKAGLADVGASAAKLVTPFTVAGTAVAALGAAFILAATQSVSDQKALETATQGLGRATGATAANLDAIATANASAGKVSTSTAREMVAAFNQTGQISTTVYGTLIQSTSEYARITGQDATAATAELARAFSDLSTGADAIAAKIGGLDDRTKQLILTQIEQGDRAGAQATAADYLKSTIDANAVATTGWAAAWNTATTAANGYWEAAKRIAGIKLGIAPEGAQEAVTRLNAEVDRVNNLRTPLGMQPLGLGDRQVAERDAASLRLDTERRIADAKAAEERANTASRTAGDVARAVDPNYARLEQLRTQQSGLRDALADPLARSKTADLGQVEDAYTATTRAISTMTDATGKMISAEEMARRSDQLRIDTINAKTDAEKASVAERQKAFDLIGKTITPSDARGQVERAGQISRLEAASKGGGGSKTEADDDFDRAVKQTENSIRKQQEQAETYGQTADVVARYRTETELLTAAKRAERDITPELTARIKDLSDQSAQAAKRNEDLKDTMRTLDTVRSTGSDGIRTLISDLQKGASAGTIFNDVLGRISTSLSNFVGDQISEGLFGRRGTSSGWLADLVRSGFGSNASSVADLSESSLGTSAVWAANGRIPGYADGRPAVVSAAGIISGPGGPTTDSIPAWVSDREAIIRASAVDHYGPEFIRSINDRTYDPKIFLSAPRHANGVTPGGGYVMPSAPRAANDSGAPTAVNLNVINQMPNAKIETREVPDGRGGRRQEMVVSETVAKGIRSPQGQAALRQQPLARR